MTPSPSSPSSKPWPCPGLSPSTKRSPDSALRATPAPTSAPSRAPPDPGPWCDPRHLTGNGITTPQPHLPPDRTPLRNRNVMTTEHVHSRHNSEQPVQLRQVRDLRGAVLGQLGQELAPDSPEKSLDFPPAF